MNPAPTTAKTSIAESSFMKGAGMKVDNGSQASGNRPETIGERRTTGFNGTSQPLRKGVKRKFLDRPENHPSIPKSAQKEFTQETEAVPSQSGGNVSLLGRNSKV